MPVDVSWDNEEHTVIYLVFDGRWSWDEVNEAIHSLNRMVDSVDHVVDGLIDMSTSVGVPPGALAQARGLLRQRHDRTGINIIVGASPMISTLWQVFVQAFQLLTRDERFFFTRTLEDARQLIAARTRSAA